MNCITSSTVQDEGSRLLSRETSRAPRYRSEPGGTARWQTSLRASPQRRPSAYSPSSTVLSHPSKQRQRQREAQVPATPQRFLWRRSSTEAFFSLFRPDFSGQPSVLSPFPHSDPHFPLAPVQLSLLPPFPHFLAHLRTVSTFAENSPPSPVLSSLTISPLAPNTTLSNFNPAKLFYVFVSCIF